MRTIKYWLEKLDEPYRSQALQNTSFNRLEWLASCIGNAIADAFAWRNTPEGHDYWLDFHRKISERYYKTAAELFEELPEDWRAKAIANTRHLTNKFSNLPNAIYYCFDWDETPEGEWFWKLINENWDDLDKAREIIERPRINKGFGVINRGFLNFSKK